MKKPGFLVVALILAIWLVPGCITVQDSAKDSCGNCAGAPPDNAGGTTSAAGTEAKSGSGGTETPGAGGSDAGGTASASAGAPDQSSAGEGGAPPQLPKTVSIEVLGAYIGPGKIDGTTWDGTGTVPDDVLAALADALGYPGVDKIADVIQDAAYQALSKPDPYGTANLDRDGSGFDAADNVELANKTNNTEDTFTPIWPMPFPGWKNLDFNEGLQVRVTLYDEDVSLDDDIGTATIPYADILAAWEGKKSYWVRVDDQTQDQLLAIEIQVSGVVK